MLHHPDKNPSSRQNLATAQINQKEDTNGNGTENLETEMLNEKIHLINQARLVLTSPQLKDEWLASFSAWTRSSQGMQGVHETGGSLKAGSGGRGPHVFRHISLDEFTPHYVDSTAGNEHEEKAEGKEEEEEEEPQYFTYPCRCSGQFVISLEQLEEGVEVVGA